MEFKFPDVGEGIHEGVIVTWLKNPGDKIKEDEAICEVETDKAVVEIPSPTNGVLKKRFHEVGETVHVGEVLVEFDTGESAAPVEAVETTTEPAQEADSANVVGALEDADSIQEETLDLTTPARKNNEPEEEKEIKAIPYVRRMAADLNVDLALIDGSGKDGQITPDDVQKAAGISALKEEAKPTSKPNSNLSTPEYGQERTEDLTQIRKAIAKNMMASQQMSAQLTHFDEICVDNLVVKRAAEKPSAEEKGIKLTYLPYIIRAIIGACEEFEKFNAAYDKESETLIIKEYYNFGVAVDTEAGLMVPVIKNVEKMSVLGIAEAITELAQKAKDRKLSLDDMKDSTITVTNYGSIGGRFATPILNYPNLVNVGVGRFEKKLELVDGQPVERTYLPLSITYDHQIIDGAEAARFTNKIREILES